MITRQTAKVKFYLRDTVTGNEAILEGPDDNRIYTKKDFAYFYGSKIIVPSPGWNQREYTPEDVFTRPAKKTPFVEIMFGFVIGLFLVPYSFWLFALFLILCLYRGDRQVRIDKARSEHFNNS